MYSVGEGLGKEMHLIGLQVLCHWRVTCSSYGNEKHSLDSTKPREQSCSLRKQKKGTASWLLDQKSVTLYVTNIICDLSYMDVLGAFAEEQNVDHLQ